MSDSNGRKNKTGIFSELSSAVKERMITLLLAGFGFVAALAWNEAVQALVLEIFPLARSGLVAKFVYAIIITIVLAVLSLRLAKLTKKEEDKPSP